MTNYRKVKQGEPGFNSIKASQDAGQWVCDSYDHNSGHRCSNPSCDPKKYTGDLLNFLIQSQRAAEYNQFIMEEFVEVMRQRGHKITFFGDEIMLEKAP